MCPEGKDTPPSAAYILSIFNIEQIEKSRTKVTARHAHIVAVFFSSHHMVTSCFKRVSPIWNPPYRPNLEDFCDHASGHCFSTDP